MSPYDFALCLWFLMLGCFLSGWGQSTLDRLNGTPTSFFRFKNYWVINAFLSYRGLWALLQIAFFSKWFTVAKFAFPDGLGWMNAYLWVCVICTLITLTQLARLQFSQKEPKENKDDEETDSFFIGHSVLHLHPKAIVRIGFYSGFACFLIACLIYFSA